MNYLNKAKVVKDDEFYTPYEDIEKAVYRHRDKFKGSIVYCNCDDYRTSNFYKLFKKKFQELGLDQVIATHYVDQQHKLFQLEEPAKPKHATFYESDYVYEHKYQEKINDITEGDGSYDSKYCKRYLRASDIVVTNPPFSIFTDYYRYLKKHKKKFLILAPYTAVFNKEIYDDLRTKQVFLSVKDKDHHITFQKENGTKKEVFCTWLTNLSELQNEKLVCTERYKKEKYQTFYEKDYLINVNRLCDIPTDYYEAMAVPITYFLFHDSEQFEILDQENDNMKVVLTDCATGLPYARGKGLCVESDKKSGNLFDKYTGKYYRVCFRRAIIKRRSKHNDKN